MVELTAARMAVLRAVPRAERKAEPSVVSTVVHWEPHLVELRAAQTAAWRESSSAVQTVGNLAGSMVDRWVVRKAAKKVVPMVVHLAEY